MRINDPNINIQSVINKINKTSHPNPILCKILEEYMGVDCGNVIDYSHNLDYLDWYPVLYRFKKQKLINLYYKL